MSTLPSVFADRFAQGNRVDVGKADDRRAPAVIVRSEATRQSPSRRATVIANVAARLVALYNPVMQGTLPERFTNWFATRGWTPRHHQLAMLAAADAGESVLLIAPTGGGKTLAGFLPSLVDLHLQPRDGLHTLYVSPLKALATDIARNLMTPVQEMNLAVRIETRTGDTPSNRRARQRVTPPQILLTTPESLAVLLSLPDSPAMFGSLTTVVMDEVHAL